MHWEENYHRLSPIHAHLLSSFQTPSSCHSKANVHPESPSPGQSPFIPVPGALLMGPPLSLSQMSQYRWWVMWARACIIPHSKCHSPFSVWGSQTWERFGNLPKVAQRESWDLTCIFQFPSLCSLSCNHLPTQETSPKKYIFKGIQNDCIFKKGF